MWAGRGRATWTRRGIRPMWTAWYPARPLPLVGRDVLGAPRAPRRKIRPPQPHPGTRKRQAMQRTARRATIPPGEPPRQDAGRRGRRPLPTWATRRGGSPTWTRRGQEVRPTWVRWEGRSTWVMRGIRPTWTAWIPVRPLPMVGRDVLGAPRAPRRKNRPPQPHPGTQKRRAMRRTAIPQGEPEPPRLDAGRRGRRPLPTWAGRGRGGGPMWAMRSVQPIVRARR